MNYSELEAESPPVRGVITEYQTSESSNFSLYITLSRHIVLRFTARQPLPFSVPVCLFFWIYIVLFFCFVIRTKIQKR